MAAWAMAAWAMAADSLAWAVSALVISVDSAAAPSALALLALEDSPGLVPFRFERIDLREGDRVEFCARVKEYEKGYAGRRDDVYKPVEIDYKLSHPTRVRKL